MARAGIGKLSGLRVAFKPMNVPQGQNQFFLVTNAYIHERSYLFKNPSWSCSIWGFSLWLREVKAKLFLSAHPSYPPQRRCWKVASTFLRQTEAHLLGMRVSFLGSPILCCAGAGRLAGLRCIWRSLEHTGASQAPRVMP